MNKDRKRLHQAISLWARTFRRCEAAFVEMEATRRKAPTMSGVNTPRLEIAMEVVADAGTWLIAIGAVRKRLDEADLPTINRLSQDSALVDAIRVEALAIAKPSLINLDLLNVLGGMA